MINQKGQAILILILLMTVALAIGLSIVQKSLVDVSTSSKVEQSSRAFSAAEAGIEKALSGGGLGRQDFTDNNAAITGIINTNLQPGPGSLAQKQDPIELFEPELRLAREDVAQFWLADYTSNNNPPDPFYDSPKIDVYWGDPTLEKAALEITLVYFDPSGVGNDKYKSIKWYLDNPSASRSPANGFSPSETCNNPTLNGHTYVCKKTLGAGPYVYGGITYQNPPIPTSPLQAMLIRVRLLYNQHNQPFAIQAGEACNNKCSFPAQVKTITSTGASGETQRKVRLTQFYKVAPHYFDYSIFSAGAITK